MDYEKIVKIDEHNLDKELVNHPQNTFIVAELCAEAKRAYDKAKEALDLVTANLDIEIRNTAEKKPTEDAIKNQIKIHPDTILANDVLIDAKYNLNMIEAAKSGLDCKRSSLENLVKLHGMAYFAEPKASVHDTAKVQEEKQKRQRRRTREKLNEGE